MNIKQSLKPLGLTLGACFYGSLAGIQVANGAENPFQSERLAGGYMLAAESADPAPKEGKCGEGKCGNKGAKEAVCGIYQIGSGHTDESKVVDGKCGGHKAVEGLCGGDR
ncbi:MAG: low-complexity protein [Gammaproteobacteria bacterium]